MHIGIILIYSRSCHVCLIYKDRTGDAPLQVPFNEGLMIIGFVADQDMANHATDGSQYFRGGINAEINLAQEAQYFCYIGI